MRNDARALAQNQEELGRRMESLNTSENKRRSLSDTDERTQVGDQLHKQESSLTNLLENVRRVSEQAEAAEPLLSRELYETFRKASQQETETNLKMTSELLNRGYVKQAAPFEQKARKEIDELKKGVERAAGNVLGDEPEALRIARAELDPLNEQLNKEIGQRAPALAPSTNEVSSAAPGDARQPAAMTAAEAAGARQQLEQLRQRQEALSRDLGNEHPEVKRGQAEIQRLEKQLAQQQRDGGGQSNQLAQAGQGQQSREQKAQSGQSQQGQPRGEREGQMAQAGQGQQPRQPSGQQPGQAKGQQPGQQQAGTSSSPQQGGEQPGQQPGDQGQPQSGQRSGQMQAGANTQRGGAQRGGDRAGGVLRELGQRTEGGLLGGWGGGATDFGP